MSISYNVLWKLLIDNNIKKVDLVSVVGVSSTVVKMIKGELVFINILSKIHRNMIEILEA